MQYLSSPYIEQKHVRGAMFGRFDGRLCSSVRGNFGVNGRDAALLLPSKALTYFIIPLK